MMKFSKLDFWRAIIAGELIALLSLPVLKNVKFFEILTIKSSLFVVLWLVFLPLVTVLGLYLTYRIALLKRPVVFELGKYGIVGWLNTFLSAGIFNLLILITGIAKGWTIDIFIIVAFIITITQSFFWNKFWIFNANQTNKAKVEYAKYFGVTGVAALFNVFLLHIIINVIGAPQGFDLKIWANIALAIVIPISVLVNFLGSKFFVFRRSAVNTNIDFIDLKRQYQTYRGELNAAISRVLNKGNYILGEEVENFEREFAKFCEVKYCIGVASGTDALSLSLRALGIKPGDEVITVSNSFIATALSISMLGAKPVFVDIDPKTYNIDPKKIEEKITPKTKAIVPVHLYGQPADMDPIKEIARRYNLRILEDACQAHGAEYKGKRVGGLGDIAAFSFNPPKNLGAYGDGGAVVTNDGELAEKILLYRTYGGRERDQYWIQGFNSRLDAMQAAILRVKLKYLNEWNRRRRKNAQLYNEFLQGSNVVIPAVLDHVQSVFHLYVIKVNRRDGLINHLRKNQVSSLVHYPTAIHLQPAYKELGYKKTDLPITEAAAQEILSLPIFPELRKDEIKYIAQSIIDYLHEN